MRAKDRMIAIVGAGPFGLSLAAHLRAAGVPFRIFGHPMQTWKTEMPRGMKLKSDGFASNLSGGSNPYTLAQFCAETGRPYHDTDIAVELETFQAYGEEFARRRVPMLERRQVRGVEPRGARFRVELEDGESFEASEVVLATGLSGFAHMPKMYRDLAPDTVSHTSAHTNFDRFAGQDVVVLGRGASSLNAAALLGEAGARVTLVSRHPKVRFHTSSVGVDRSLYHRLRHPRSTVGSSLRSWFIAHAPGAVQRMPAWMRRVLAFKHLGPSGGYWLHDKVVGKMPVLAGWHVESAAMRGDDRVALTLTNASGEQRFLVADHVIAGTGFLYDLKGLRFLSATLVETLRTDRAGAPRLNRRFESSVRGLFFAGPAAAGSFGQLLRFVAGAEFTAETITKHFVHLQEKYLRGWKAVSRQAKAAPNARLQRPAPARNAAS